MRILLMSRNVSEFIEYNIAIVALSEKFSRIP